MRLVFACDNGNWMPMVLDQQNNLGFHNPYFSYEVFKLGSFNYLKESLTIADGAKYSVHQRVLAICDFYTQPLLNVDSIPYFELIEITPYHHALNLPIYLVAYSTATFPQVMQNWLNYNNLSNNKPGQPLNGENVHLQEAIALRQKAEIELAKTKELFIQAQQKLALIEQAHNSMASQKQDDNNLVAPEARLPKAATQKLALDVPTNDNSLPLNNVQESLSKLECTTRSLVVTQTPQNSQLQESLAATELLPKPSKGKAKNRLNFTAVLKSLEENIKNSETINDEILQDLKNLDGLLTATSQHDLFVAQLKGMPANVCAQLLTNINVASNIKALLLKILVGYDDLQYNTIEEKSCLVEIAKNVTTDKDLLKKLKRQKLRKVVRKLDFDEFIHLITDDLHCAKYGHEVFVKSLSHVAINEYQSLIKFIGLKDITFDFCMNVLQDSKMLSHVRMVAMYKLQGLSAEEYYFQDQKFNFSQMYENFCGEIEVRDVNLQNMLTLKKLDAEQWFLDKSKEIFANFNDLKAKKIDNSLLSLFSQEVNEQGQTLLMLAIQKQYNIEKIRTIIQAGGKSILAADHNNQNIFHYLAKYGNLQNISLFKEIRMVFEAEAKKANLDIVDEVNRREIASGNTYLHWLLQGKNKEYVLQVLKQLFVSFDDNNNLEHFCVAILLRNNSLESISMMLDSKNQEWTEVRELLYIHAAKISFKLQDKHYKDLHAWTKGGFFTKSIQEDVIFSLLKNNDFNRLLYILEARLRFFNSITDEFAQQILYYQQCRLELQRLHEQKNVIYNYFFMPVLSQISYKDKSLHKCFAEFIVAKKDVALEKIYLNSLFFVTKPPVSIADTIQWVRLRGLVSKKIYNMENNKAGSKDDDKVGTFAAKSFAQCVLANPQYTEEFINSAKDAKNAELLAAILSSTKMEDCIKIMSEVCNIINRHPDDFIILDNIAYRLRDDVFVALMMYLLGSCLVSNNVGLIQHMVKIDGFIIDDDCVDIALNDVKKDNLEVFEFILDKYIDASTISPSVVGQRLYNLWAWTIHKKLDLFVIEFVLNKYDPVVGKNNNNKILVKLLFSAAQGSLSTKDLGYMLQVMQILFADAERAQKIAQIPKAMYFLGIIGTHKEVDMKSLVQMFKLFLDNGAKLDDLVMGFVNPIQYTICVGSLGLLNLFAQYIKKADLYLMLVEKDNDDKVSVIEYSTKEVEKGKLDEEILERLEELANETNPNPVSRIINKIFN